MHSLWKFLTSLRLTVVCLALAILLVFIGTVAQADEGLYQAQERYFKHWIVIGATMWGKHVPIILPGGYTLGVALLANLIAAHIKRFKWAASKIGIHLTHAGIIVLLVGQLSTDMTQVESRMTFFEGESTSYLEHHRDGELVFLTDAGNGQDEVVSFPEKMLKEGAELAHPKLPFTVRIQQLAPNGNVAVRSEVIKAGAQLQTALATLEGEYSTAEGLVPQAERAGETPGRMAVWRQALKAVGETNVDDIVGAAKRIAAQPEREGKLRAELKARFRSAMIGRFESPMQKPEMILAAQKIEAGEPLDKDSIKPVTQGAGPSSSVLALPAAKDMDTRNVPFAVLEIVAGGKSLGTWLASAFLRPQEITVGDKTFRMSLRDQRTYLPFSLKLLQATHKKYAGSDTPKDFRSRVLIENPETKEHRETEISMNSPLRYHRLAFFQYQMTKDEVDASPGRSVLQVVRNPSWLAPYIGCIVVTLGMLWQFLHHLVGFITKRRTA